MTGLLLGLLGGLLLAAVAVGAFWLGSRQNDDTSVASTAVGGNDEAEDAATTAGDPATPTTADGVATSTDDDVGGDAVGDAGADAGSATDDGGSVAAGDSVDGTNPVGAADGQLLLPDGFVPSDPNYEQRIQNAPQYAVVRGGIVYLYGFARSQELLDEAIAVTAGVMGPEGYVVERIVDPDAPEVDGAPIYVDDKVLFAFNSTELDPASLPILDLGVALMLQNPTAEMVIIARSDAVGSADTNLEISERRGQAVVEYWASKGVETERMTVDARGEADASEDDDEQTAALNRSVEFVVSGIADG
ncbi:MAG: OmpA family protein [Actinomycetota bacterium]